mmetsp:Transcript_16920/g.39336  ORF Transcript_16920/g.39336 Transcript_16920/m.39336 type:complete len:205 (+) Transcript_16920:722-1336(+)
MTNSFPYPRIVYRRLWTKVCPSSGGGMKNWFSIIWMGVAPFARNLRRVRLWMYAPRPILPTGCSGRGADPLSPSDDPALLKVKLSRDSSADSSPLTSPSRFFIRVSLTSFIDRSTHVLLPCLPALPALSLLPLPLSLPLPELDIRLLMPNVESMLDRLGSPLRPRGESPSPVALRCLVIEPLRSDRLKFMVREECIAASRLPSA